MKQLTAQSFGDSLAASLEVEASKKVEIVNASADYGAFLELAAGC